MRSLALAQRWQACGGAVTFLSRCESDALRRRVLEAGMQFFEVENPHPHPSDLSLTLATLERLKGQGSKTWLVLDGYHFDPDYQQAIRSAPHPLLLIDDTAHHSVYHADVLVNQNITAPYLDYRCDSDTVLLLGTKYALLREEFLGSPKGPRETPEVACKILVTLGGSDPDNVTEKIIEALKRAELPCMQARIIAGAANRHLPGLRRALEGAGSSLELIEHSAEMPELMAWADLAVSAAGSTCWELCFMGVPSMLVVIADNQRALAAEMARQRGAILLGEGERIKPSEVMEQLMALALNQRQRAMLSARGREIVDGRGAGRVTEALGLADAYDES